jgi:triacylglycerol lipase
VRTVTGAVQVDVFGHSKGATAARAFASGVRLPWMRPYQGEIRRLVLAGGPQMGIDLSFRHPIINLALYPEKSLLNAPLSWTKMLAYGSWKDTRELSLMTDGGNYFPGQSQMLYRLDKLHPLPTSREPDVLSTYNGGRGLLSYSDGIDAAIAQGGHYIDTLRLNPLDPCIELAVMAGDRATRLGMFNEFCGPSDGTVFVASALATDDMTRNGAHLLAKDVLPLNHGELIYAKRAKAHIIELLTRA